jgi:tetratricopeptide (TPR) repeat protein
MRHLVFTSLLVCGLAFGQPSDEDLQRAFIQGAQQLQAGKLAQAESTFRAMLEVTDSPRVKLELARTLFLQGRYDEAKVLFKEVSLRSDTPWRVRDNVSTFVRHIEERTGYLKWGVTMVSDSNPGNLARQKEFSIGDLQVTPVEAPKRLTGLRYSVQGWQPLAPIGGAGYLTASYVDYPTEEFDRLTVDVGLAKNIVDSGRVRGKAGLEFGTSDGSSLYQFPYLGLDAVLAQSEAYRLAGELKFGKVRLSDFDYLNATYRSAALSLRRELSQSVAGTVRAAVEGSRAAEQPYTYYGWDLAPGISTFWPETTFLVGATLSFGKRKYAEVDPLFARRREDEKTRLEVTVGNKKWRWRDSYVALVASLEENRSNIGFFDYQKTNLSVVIE